MKDISFPRIIIGGFIIVIGAALLLSNLGADSYGEVLRKTWPAIIIVLGLMMLLNKSRDFVWAFIVIAAGVLWQLNALDIINVSVWHLFWPVLIIIVGLSLMFNRKGSTNKKTALEVSQSEHEDIIAILSGSEQSNRSDDFKASKITAVMGGVKLDLSKATIHKEATVEIFSLWGGVELVVPENVMVHSSTLNILGGIEDKTAKPTKKDAPVLRVIGDVIMAGVEIKN